MTHKYKNVYIADSYTIAGKYERMDQSKII